MAEGLRQRAMELLGAALAAVAAPRPSGGGTKVLRQPATDASTTWSIESVREALNLHERGEFSRSAQLVEAMGRDDRIASCLNTRLYALAGANGVEFSIQPPDGQDDALANEVNAWWFAALPDATLRQLLGDAIMIGVAVARVHWATSGKAWEIACIERWHPQHVRWDDYTRRFVVRTESEELSIDPGDPSWLVITPGGSESWLCGAVRALGFAYVARSWNWRDWARFNERHGMPLIVVKEPPILNTDERKAFWQSLKTMGSKGMLRLPQSADGVSGYDVDFREAKDTAHETFQTFRSDLDVSIAVFLLGQNLTTEGKGGSYALGQVHDRVRGDYLAADAEGMSTPLREQVVAPWCVFNRGVALELVPWPTWETAAPADLGAESTTLKTFGEAVASIRNAGVPLDGIELAKRFRVPLIEDAPMGEVYRAPAPGQGGPEKALEPGKASKPAPGAKGAAKALATASGVPVMSTSGLVSGQLYVDEVADDYRPAVGQGLRGTLLTDLLAAIDGAETYEEIRSAVLRAYGDAAPPDQVRDLVAKALVLTDLAGAAAVREDA